VLKLNDVRMLAVALEGLENTFENGSKHHLNENNENKFTLLMDNLGYLDLLENL